MKTAAKTCLIIFGLAGLNSCVSQKQTPPDPAPAAVPAVKSDAASAQSVKTAPASSYSSSHVTASPMNGNDADMPEVSTETLPGEKRGNLRIPDMPTTLPLTIEGKINTEGKHN